MTQQPSIKCNDIKETQSRTSLVVHWIRICLPMQETQVWSLVREDPTCRGATKPVGHNYWACARESRTCNCWSLNILEPVLCKKRSQHSEKTQAPQLEKSLHRNEDPEQPEIINKNHKKETIQNVLSDFKSNNTKPTEGAPINICWNQSNFFHLFYKYVWNPCHVQVTMPGAAGNTLVLMKWLLSLQEIWPEREANIKTNI